jgi:hypothetical protein
LVAGALVRVCVGEAPTDRDAVAVLDPVTEVVIVMVGLAVTEPEIVVVIVTDVEVVLVKEEVTVPVPVCDTVRVVVPVRVPV